MVERGEIKALLGSAPFLDRNVGMGLTAQTAGILVTTAPMTVPAVVPTIIVTVVVLVMFLLLFIVLVFIVPGGSILFHIHPAISFDIVRAA